MNPWSKFFCASCQTERPISERRKVGRSKLSRCVHCANKSRFLAETKVPRPEEDRNFEPYEPPSIPEDVMAAYREALE